MRWSAAIAGVVAAACNKSPAPIDATACGEPPPERTGEATYYDADGSGNCSFDPSPAGEERRPATSSVPTSGPSDLMVAAMNGVEYDMASWCGGCVEVDGPRGSVVVRIVDSCPGCAAGDLDLSREAFAVIADLPQGRVPITWRAAACDVTGPVRYRFKEGSNASWIAIQVRNHRYPIARLEAHGGDGAWRDFARADYNYFVDTGGLGGGPFAIQITDDRGQTLVDTNVPFAEATEVPGAAQLPACR
jgi:expansin (peptidoglycan-binding protein)